MKPIICLTDFTERSEDAMRIATAFGRQTNDPIVLVRSVDERGFFPDYTRGRLMLDDEPRLRQEAERLSRLGYVFQCSLLRGGRSDTVARLAQRIGARLLIWAADPLSRLECWAVGCTGEHVAATLRIPLLAIRSAAALECWFGGARPLRVLVSLDVERDSVAFLGALADLQAIGRCEISVVPAPAPSDADLQAVADFVAQTLGAAVASGVHAIGPMHLAHQVVEHAVASHADLIVVGTHPAAEMPLVILRTLSGCLLRRSSVNVLCVPNAGATFQVERAILGFRKVTAVASAAAT